MTIVKSESFEYKATLVGKTKKFADQKSSVKDTKIVVPLKYLSKPLEIIRNAINKLQIGLRAIFYQALETIQNLRQLMLNCMFL